MLDRRWRKGVEQGLGPIGDRLRRSASPPTLTGSVSYLATAVPSSGHFVAGRVDRGGVSDLLDGTIAAAAKRVHGRLFGLCADRARALLFGGIAWHLAALRRISRSACGAGARC
jgi:hypothetical protein